PLLEVRRGEWEVRDVQNVADVLVDPEGSLERRNHWEKTSHSLLVGTILHVLYAEADKTLGGVASFLSDPRRPIETTLVAMMTTPHLGKKGPHPVVASAARVLLMLDEFPALGRLDFFESALAFMAGYGLKSFLIAQSLNQIEKAYGANNSILDNCHVRVSFATNDERTAKRVSDALGTATEMRAMKNYAGHRLSP